jgi:hypothetical protein
LRCLAFDLSIGVGLDVQQAKSFTGGQQVNLWIVAVRQRATQQRSERRRRLVDADA